MADKLPLHHKHGLMVWNGTAWVNASADSSGALNVVTSGGGGGGGAVTIADGANVVEGALADAAVIGDNSGTLSAKIRGLSKIFANVWDSVNGWIKVSVQQMPNTVALPFGADTITDEETSATVQTFKYRTGGAAGTVVKTLVVTYTDSTRATLSSAVYS